MGAGGAVACEAATLVSGQAVSVSLNVSPTGNTGMFQSTAQMSGNGQDPASDNNSAMIVTTVAAVATPTPTPQPTPMSERRGGGGGGSMAPLLLLALAVLAMSRVAVSRRSSGAAVSRA
jgi:hypothetical protein